MQNDFQIAGKNPVTLKDINELYVEARKHMPSFADPTLHIAPTPVKEIINNNEFYNFKRREQVFEEIAAKRFALLNALKALDKSIEKINRWV